MNKLIFSPADLADLADNFHVEIAKFNLL